MKNSTKTKQLLGAAAVALSTAFVGTGTMMLTPAVAQDATSGALTGTVTDASGNPVSGATVTVTSNDRGFTRTATTSASGSYRISQLPSGSYTARISAGGYESVVNEGIRITISSTAALNAALATATAGSTDEIVVVGQSRSISAFDANTTGLTIDVGELNARIPVQRSIQGVALLAPGTAGTDSGFTAGTNRGGAVTQFGISGSSVGENQFFVNGFNISDFNDFIGASVLPFEFYDQVEVKTGGVSAEFGRATGGFVNATTKSGSNEFEGGINMYWAPDAFQEDPRNTYNIQFDDTQPQNAGARIPLNANNLDETDTFETNIFVSGPIIEDKLFYFLMVNPNQNSQTDIINNRAFVEKTTSPTYGAKLDFFLTDTQHFEYTFFQDEVEYLTDYYGVTTSATGVQTGVDESDFYTTESLTNGGQNHIFKYSGSLTDWLDVSASYGTGENKNVRTANNSALFAATDFNTNVPLTKYGPGIFETTVNQRDAYRVDLDIEAEFLGLHQFRLGWDREELTAAFDDRYPGAESWIIDLDAGDGDVRGAMANTGAGGPFTLDTRGGFIQVRSFNPDGSVNRFRVRSRIASAEFETQNEAFYLQDAWNIHPNVNLNLGVRAETFQNSNAAGEVFYETDTLISPRLGVNWDVAGDGTLQLSGFYGRYYLPIATNTNFRLAGNERDVRAEYTATAGFDLNNFIDPATGRIANATYFGSTTVFSDGFGADTRESVSANLEPQYVDEWVLSANHVITDSSPLWMGGLLDEWEVGISLTQRELYDALEDAAVDAAVLEYCAANNITGCESTWSGFHHYVLVNPGGPIEYATDDAPIGTGTGDFVELNIDGSFLPEAERTYQAVTLSFSRPYDGKWSLNGNYTYSDLEGNYEGSVKSDNAQTDAGLTTDFDQPGLTDGAFGKLPQHRKHQLKLWGSYDFTERMRMGANYSLSSPRQFGCVGNHPSDDFAALYDVNSWYCVPSTFSGFAYQPLEIFGVVTPGDVGLPAGTPTLDSVSNATPRGSQLESDWIHNVNVSFAYQPPVADDRVTLRVDVFNLFDQQGVTDLEEEGEVGGSFGPIYYNPNYGEARSYQAPRSVRFGVEIDF